MRLISLSVDDLRVVKHAEFQCDAPINYFFGRNGAGKTALLEATHLLACGQSFRSTQLRHLIRRDRPLLRVSGELQDTHGSIHRLGIEKHRNGTTRIRINGENVKRVSTLAAYIPLRAVAPDSHALISGGPANRRRFIDWGVFHVEQSERFPWRHYARALEQRNALLKYNPDPMMLDAIDLQLADHGTAMAVCRQEYVSRIAKLLPVYVRAFSGSLDVLCHYSSGWRGDMDLAEALQQHRPECLRHRVTSVGPHRADLVLTVGDKPARDVLSRGQQKALLYALTLAQADDFQQQSGRKMILLCDDLASELDKQGYETVLERLIELGHQLFVTGVETQKTFPDQQARVFHVEHGKANLVLQ